jgi:outer membrane lipoprotein SlyB
MEAISRKGGLLYPMLVIAAIAVIVFSVTGIATMMGWLPSALSERDSAAKLDQPVPRSEVERQLPAPSVSREEPLPAPRVSGARDAQLVPPPPTAACTKCGVVESIRAVEVQGQSSWLGAAGGAVVGGLVGNQIGHGRGRTAATVVGAGAGAYTGNEIEKNVNKSVRYRVRVRMEDGTHRTFHQAAQPSYAVGQKVRVTDRGITPAG